MDNSGPTTSEPTDEERAYAPDTMPAAMFLAANAAVGGLCLVSGGWRSVLVPFGLVIVVASVVGVVSRGLGERILSAQALALLAAAVMFMAWSAWIALTGIHDTDFTWGVGLLTAGAVYSSYLCARFPLRAWRSHPAIASLTVIVGLVALLLDLAVFVRFELSVRPL